MPLLLVITTHFYQTEQDMSFGFCLTLNYLPCDLAKVPFHVNYPQIICNTTSIMRPLLHFDAREMG